MDSGKAHRCLSKSMTCKGYSVKASHNNVEFSIFVVG